MGKFDRDMERIAASGLFDCDWYLDEYPDVKALGANPIEHYLVIGAGLLRDPSRKFSTKTYLESRPDVQTSGVNPLLHYLIDRASNLARPGDHPDAPLAGCDISSRSITQRPLLDPAVAEALGDTRLFDIRFYQHKYGIASGQDCIIDFLSNPSRQPSPYFDPAWYFSTYPGAALRA